MSQSEWDYRIEEMRHDGAHANAELLTVARERWESNVVLHVSMGLPFFTRVGDEYPFDYSVSAESVDKQGAEFVVTLWREPGYVCTRERCFAPRAPAVLDEFLELLVRTDMRPPRGAEKPE
jgi:hypothetical protein